MEETVFKPEDHPISGRILGAAIEVHRHLGPGLLESVYEECLARELGIRGLTVDRQRLLPVSYEGYNLETYFRIDMIVENSVLVEIKVLSALLPFTLPHRRMGSSALSFNPVFNSAFLRASVPPFPTRPAKAPRSLRVLELLRGLLLS